MAISFEDFAGRSRPVVSDEARTASFAEIPIIDLAPFLKANATAAEKIKVVHEVLDACRNVGFLYIKGHGLSQTSMNKAFEESKRSFKLSTDEKMRTYFRHSPQFRGFEPSKGETHVTGDIKGAFNFGYEPEADPLNPSNDLEAFLAETPNGGRNIWPDAVPELKSSLFEYYSQVLGLGRQMVKIFALALELPEEYFDKAFKVPGALARTLYYPPQPPASDVDDGTIGVAAHTDIECFTFLLQGPNVSCLQVLNKAGEWVEAPPIPGTLVMNVGDMLCRWTNNHFVSTVHRVINRTGEPRQSIPVFFAPSYDTCITALPGCVAQGSKPSYPPISAGEYVYRRLARSQLGIKFDESVPLADLLASQGGKESAL